MFAARTKIRCFGAFLSIISTVRAFFFCDFQVDCVCFRFVCFSLFSVVL